MKILLTIILLLSWQISIVTAQKISAKNPDRKDETVVPIIKQTGSLRFDCLETSGVFNNSYEFESRVKGSETCVNPLDLIAVDFEKQTLIGYRVLGDCFLRFRAEVFRNDEAKIYRVNIVKKSGRCRAGGAFQGWIIIDKILQNYKVEFTETRLKEDEDFKIELLEETLSMTEESQEVKTRKYAMERCADYFRAGGIIKSETELLERVRDDASRKACLEKLEKIDFKKEILLGTSIYSGYCRYPAGLKYQVMRDDRRKRYVVFITYDDPYGRTCRALGMYDLWLAVPKPPDDYEIKFEVASILNKSFDY